MLHIDNDLGFRMEFPNGCCAQVLTLGENMADKRSRGLVYSSERASIAIYVPFLAGTFFRREHLLEDGKYFIRKCHASELVEWLDYARKLKNVDGNWVSQ